MFDKINFPFFQNQWFGIDFTNLNTKKHLFKRANKNFYTNFHKEFKKYIKILINFPQAIRREKIY